MTRYFSAVVFAGRLHVEGIPDRGPWDPNALFYWEEGQVDLIFNPLIRDRKVNTAQELKAAVTVSRLRQLRAVNYGLRGGKRLESMGCRQHRSSGRSHSRRGRFLSGAKSGNAASRSRY